MLISLLNLLKYEIVLSKDISMHSEAKLSIEMEFRMRKYYE